MMHSYILDLAKRRKTVRIFSQKPVDLKDVLVALETACQAPSGANFQPWRFVIVTDSRIKRKIREACERGEKEFYSKVRGELRQWLLKRGLSWKKAFLEEAPVLMLILSERKAPYSTESVWLAIGYLVLSLEEHELGTVTYTPSTPEAVLEEMAIPKEFRLEAILPIGVSADEKTKEPRLGFDKVTFLNTWGHSFYCTSKKETTSNRICKSSQRLLGSPCLSRFLWLRKFKAFASWECKAYLGLV